MERGGGTDVAAGDRRIADRDSVAAVASQGGLGVDPSRQLPLFLIGSSIAGVAGCRAYSAGAATSPVTSSITSMTRAAFAAQ